MCKTLRPALTFAFFCVLASLLPAPRGFAAPPPSGSDFFISSDFDGGSNTIAEYTADGRLVQTIPVPANTGSYSQNGTEFLRGIAATDAGEIVGFNGTFSPELTTFHPRPRSFSSRTAPGWGIFNSVYSGSIGVFQGYSFVITNIGGSPPAIIRFNPDGSSQRFGVGLSYLNLAVGLDGKLYALRAAPANGVTQFYVDVFDPVSLQILRAVPLQVPAQSSSNSTDLHNLTVDAQGSIYALAGFSVYHFDVAGNLLQAAGNFYQSASLGQGGYSTDIKIDPSSGRLLISVSRYGAAILQTDASLSSFQTLVQLDPNQFENCFITFSNARLATALLPVTHLLWNNVDGRVMLWSIDGAGGVTLNGFGPYTDGAPQNKWSATAVATGPDGLSHLLWNNTDGRVMLWTVDDGGNFTLAGYGPYTDDSVGSDPTVNKWKATAVSVGPDNVVHLLWSNTDHRVMLWNVAPDFTFTLAGYGPYTDTSVSSDPGNLWSAAALATGPDGVSRIAWNNVDGRVMLWDVAPDFTFTLAGYGPYTDNAPQNKWGVTGVSVGPDNLTHLLWNNTDRRAMFWDVDSAFGFTVAGGYGPYTDNGFGSLWSATALATGPDGLSRIVWNNTDSRVMLWAVDNAGGFGGEGNFGVTDYGPYTDDFVSLDPGNLWSATAVSAGP